MSLFKHSYSGLITNGLGLGACCGLLTMGFSVFKCNIEIVPPYVRRRAVSGGSVPVGSFYIPVTKPITYDSRVVIVTVKVKENTWKKAYVVDKSKADIIVRVINVITTIKTKISSIKRSLTNATITMFKPKE